VGAPGSHSSANSASIFCIENRENGEERRGAPNLPCWPCAAFHHLAFAPMLSCLRCSLLRQTSDVGRFSSLQPCPHVWRWPYHRVGSKLLPATGTGWHSGTLTVRPFPRALFSPADAELPHAPEPAHTSLSIQPFPSRRPGDAGVRLRAGCLTLELGRSTVGR
jgi:hypothetical protein